MPADFSPWSAVKGMGDHDYTSSYLGNGHIWVCLSLVPYDRFGAGNLVRLPLRSGNLGKRNHRIEKWLYIALSLGSDDISAKSVKLDKNWDIL